MEVATDHDSDFIRDCFTCYDSLEPHDALLTSHLIILTCTAGSFLRDTLLYVTLLHVFMKDYSNLTLVS